MEIKLKKIGILAFSDKLGGGVYQYTQSIIDALKEDGTKKYIIFCNIDDTRFDNYNLEVRKMTKYKNSIFKMIIMTLQFLFFFRKPLILTKQEIKCFSDIDMFIAPSISAYPHFFLNKPFIFTLHDMQERYYPEFFSIYRRFTRWLNNRTLAQSATKIICESKFVKNDIIKFTGTRSNKISIIQSPPPQEFLDFEFEDNQFGVVREKYNLPQKYIFYPAQCWLHKNHIKLVEAFNLVSEKYSDINLILTGSQKDDYPNIESKINQLGLNDKIKHLGYIDYEDLPYLYKMSQMLIMPTLFESVSIPIYEAFSLEVPVCSSNVVALPEQVGDAGLLFNPNSIEDIANKIIEYLSNSELKKNRALKGFNKVLDFNHQEYKKQLIEVLNG
jgi:glycosyltransferase involved in cell wall biosynthesis